ncbi:DUF1579 family protein [Siphonobacter sp.]|uniref:DUF1579 family protein n=1 Tax=Siphonobacter sp. TaxID=1869184 RepID=UPI003B3A2BDB
MKKASFTLTFTLLFIGYWAQAQTPAKAPGNQQEAMTQLLNYSRPGPNHALLATLVGTWTFQDKNLPFVKGTVVRKSVFEGRFFWVEITGGQLEIPIADGKTKLANYQGLEIEGYDNVKKSYVTTTINNHIGSNAAQQIGQYDAQNSLITYEWESELLPGVRQKNRKVLHLLDPDHYIEEYYEQLNGHSKKTRELLYTKTIAK